MVHPALDVLESQLRERYESTRFRAASVVLRLVDLKLRVRRVTCLVVGLIHEAENHTIP